MTSFSKKDRYSNQFIKKNVEFKEYIAHKIIYNLKLVNVPEIYYYDKINKIMYMQKINSLCVADKYGEDINTIPINIINKIRSIIEILYYNYMEYPDITGYNFIEDNNGKIWIIDFGHASSRDPDKLTDPFIIQFINGLNKWNPDFI